MSISERLEMLISLDPSQGIRGLESFARSAEDNTKKAESSLGRIGTAALKLGAGGLAAGGFLTAMASKDIEASQQLEAAIQTTGHSVDEYKGRIDAAVGSMAKFGHTDEEVNSALRVLVGSYGDTNKALDQMQTVADLAAFKHISLADAANIVAKAHGGAGRVFKEFNIQVQTNADGTKNYDGALTELSKKLSGQASASADTFGGKLAELRAEVENQVSAFGQKWGPTIMASSGALTVLGGAATGLQSILGKTGIEMSKTQLAGAAMGAGIVAAAYMIGSSMNDLAGDFDKVSQQLAKLGNDELVHVGEQMVDLAAKGGTFGDPAKASLERLAQSGEEGLGTIVRLRDGMQAQGKDVTVLNGIIDQARAAQDNMNASQQAGAGTTMTLDQAYKALHDTIHASIDPVFALNKAINDNTDAEQKAQAAAMAVSQAQDAYNQAVAQFGPNSAQAQTAGLALMDAQGKLTDANDAAASSALSVNDAAQQLSKGLADGSVSADQMKATLIGWVQQGLLTSAQAQDIADRLGVVIDKARQLDGKSINFSVNGNFTATGDLANIIGMGLTGPGVHRAAAGFAGTVRGPTGFLTGEGGEPEDVLIVPHSKGGIGFSGGSSGGDLHLYIGTVIGSNLKQAAEEIRRELLKKSARNPSGVIGLL